MAIKVYEFKTRVGLASITSKNGRWLVYLSEEDLGSYFTPQQAVDDLVGGHTFSHSSGVDTSKLGIPRDVLEWECI